MEQVVKDGLNFILGAVSAIKTETESAISKFNTEFQSLAAKGAQDQSETSVNLRKYLQEGLTQLEALAGKVNSTVEETKQKVASVTSKA
ncbi:hypothetical protein LPTSP4_33000 [Leptospira ryugenii]|uniref:Uncharacterized protein n=1 Tax=Leptospira ryugenii TaxID=1917863 RepID=A0A2P2E4H2_9LEPT|nr:hypothetical protein [Leptospira ryugenii]GBF51762.1 hypothetical protein LPTSP4_33000 [Leptospira ryugenii]